MNPPPEREITALPAPLTIDLTAPATPTPTPDEDLGSALGKLVDEDGAPIPDTRVVLFEKQLQTETQIGDATTSATGAYSIKYVRPQALNLIARAADAEGNVIATSVTLFAAPAEVEIDLTTTHDGVVRTAERAVTDLSAPLTIDLTAPVPPVTETPIGPGTTTNPQGHTVTADSRSLLFDGVRVIPVGGEFQYSRYPREEWREALRKMKAGGVSIVSTYVFWIHHEEERGQFDWRGRRSLRSFLEQVREAGLKAMVRMGPWCHGEVRNGGFPDWARAYAEYGSTDPGFLALIEPLYEEIGRQMRGLLWKDGGPVIGVQLDNEHNGPEYLLALKQMARNAGVDVPFYTMTGWNQVAIPKEGLLPLFGAYAAGFWKDSSPESSRKAFMFSNVRDDGDLGAQMENVRPARNGHIESFPFVCVEIGPGMASSYHVRLKMDDDTSAMALVKLGCGNNMPGYYLFHGGTNPDGRLTTLHEEKPNAMPVKDYDLQAAVGATGQVRRAFHWLRGQHLFLQDSGAALAGMPAFFPDRLPKDLKDTTTLRWSVRADAQGRGFLFFNNRQPADLPLPEKKEVRFELKTRAGSVRVPREPITIPSGAFGIWPVGLDCGGVGLDYATVQPLGQVADGDGVACFFTAIEGVRPELALAGGETQRVIPGTGPALTARNAKGQTVTFVVLTPEQGRGFYRDSFAGCERAILSKAVVWAEGSGLRLQTDRAANREIAFYPPVPAIQVAGTTLAATGDGVFSRFVLPDVASEPVNVTLTRVRAAGPKATPLQGTEEATWEDAAIYQVDVPDAAAGRRLVLDIHYIGDVARFYAGDHLVLDHFYNGDPLSVALWRIPREEQSKLRLKVLPYSDGLAAHLTRLPGEVLQKVAQARAAGTLDQITITATELLDIQIAPA